MTGAPSQPSARQPPPKAPSCAGAQVGICSPWIPPVVLAPMAGVTNSRLPATVPDLSEPGST
jgi:hypothetical protein